MSTRYSKELSGPDFERSLLDSARADPLPQNVQIAWANFAGAMRSAASHVEPGSGLHTIEHSGKNASLGQGVSAGSGKAAAWLMLGAIGGSALTAALLLARAGVPPIGHAGARTQLPLAVSAPGQASSKSELAAVVPTGGVAVSDMDQAPLRQHSALQTRATKPSARNGLQESPIPTSTEVPKSALAAEVRRLDAARTACRNGAYNEAIRVVENYHREFPQGVLAPDADVVKIEAFVGKRDHAAVVQHATAFLAEYPKDPHAAMVQRWAGQ